MELITATTLLVLAFVSFRVTRLIVIDDILETPRSAVRGWFLSHGKAGTTLFDLLGCTWCVGVYVSAAVYWLYLQDFQLSVETFLNIAAIAGAQGLLHAFEPGDE